MNLGYCNNVFYIEVDELRSVQARSDLARLIRSVYEVEHCAELHLFADHIAEFIKDFKYDIIILFFDADRNLMRTGCNHSDNLGRLIESITKQTDPAWT